MIDEPFAITLDVGSSLANHTGAWRTDRPVRIDRPPPCSAACPAGEDIRGWLRDAEEGGYEAAWRRIVAANPMPAITGRVCFHPCRSACNRGQLDTAVGINSVERFLGDAAIEAGWSIGTPAAPTGHRVLVVGAGPAGLSAAARLALLGHAVTVRDAQPQAGGMLRYGIPAYRLPRDVLDATIAAIERLGVTIETGAAVDDLDAVRTEFDAVLLAVGATRPAHRTAVPAGDGARVLDALTMLHDVAAGDPPALGRRVVVYGGGDTALDAARTAARLGATEPLLVYRRTRDRMPAHAEELTESTEEGIAFRWLSTVTHADGGTLTVERVELDADGVPRPTGELDELAADTLVLALGQDVDLSRLAGAADLLDEDGTVAVDAGCATRVPGVFAAGDAIGAERTVATAVGHGARAARRIHELLGGGVAERPAAPVTPITVDLLNPVYYSDAPAAMALRLDPVRRASTFDEVVPGLDADTALYEARRCLSCGTCFGCDNCYGLCPDNAVHKLGDRLGEDPATHYVFDYDYCKGCGICVSECPSGAIVMVPEES